ncbi:carboxylesterase family protein [Corynebacterium provencense]|uniref:carboxylesterase family protein n=1 Tax=Corynebacterium provencense TaxID=1737425 RepID=UPI000836C489|nr:carboxylesterase family protein [Corynebacterium provencense]
MTDSRAPLFTTPHGTVSGTRRGGVHVFRAVPVAHSPGFAPPAPPESWQGVLDCSDSSRRRGLRTATTVSVFAPEGAEVASCPVIAWIHGGRFEEGHGDDGFYDGSVLASAGCVVVTLNYRKCLEGFIPLDGDTPGAFRGVDDLVHALRWVQDAVSAVGGDPDNVTLAGQSAGGGLIMQLLTERRADALFHRAVVLSPGLPRIRPRNGWRLRRAVTAAGLGGPLTLERVSDLGEDRLRRAARPFSFSHSDVDKRPGGSRGSRGATRAPRLPPGPTPGAAPLAPGGPLTLERVSDLGEDRLRRAYRLLAGVYATDCALGPGPVDLHRLRDVPLLVSTMEDELVRFPGVAGTDRWLHRSGLPAGVLAPGMLALGVPPGSLAAWCRQVDGDRPLGRTVGDTMVRRWASGLLEAAPGRDVWACEFRGGELADGQRIDALHCGELPVLFGTVGVDPPLVRRFCGPDAPHRLEGLGRELRSEIVSFAHGREPGWPRWAEGRISRIFDLTGGPSTTGRDILRTVRTLLPL